MHVGPHPRRLNGTLGTSHSTAPFRNRSEAFDTAGPSQIHEQRKVPDAVLPGSPPAARPEGSERRLAQQIALAFHIQIDKDVVRRILGHHCRPGQPSGGPSWLTFLGHMKDSLWSMDLFRCESATLRTHWVLVVMDQYTRRIIGFGVHAGSVDGVALCRMFNRAIRGQPWMSKYLSSDNDPLYRFHQWQANLRVLELTEIKSIPYVPLSHPFVERLIGTFVVFNKIPFCGDPCYVAQKPERPIRLSARRPLRNISCFGLLYSRDGYSIPTLEVEDV
jgi:transposase InsO family protein